MFSDYVNMYMYECTCVPYVGVKCHTQFYNSSQDIRRVIHLKSIREHLHVLFHYKYFCYYISNLNVRLVLLWITLYDRLLHITAYYKVVPRRKKGHFLKKNY